MKKVSKLTPAQKAKPPLEKDIQRQILDYLALKKVFHYRNNSGAFKTDSGHLYRFGENGSPDIICVIDGIFVGIEVKRPGGKQSEHQKDFQKRLEKAGGRYWLVRSLEEVEQELKKYDQKRSD